MEFADDSFDLVWACESGEHMPDKKAYVEEMSRVLAPGGQVGVGFDAAVVLKGGACTTAHVCRHLAGRWVWAGGSVVQLCGSGTACLGGKCMHICASAGARACACRAM
jgi:SAM-dependent methyltransferase